MVQNQCYHFGIGAPILEPILVVGYFSGWIGKVHGGTIWLLTLGPNPRQAAGPNVFCCQEKVWGTGWVPLTPWLRRSWRGAERRADGFWVRGILSMYICMYMYICRCAYLYIITYIYIYTDMYITYL